MVEQKQTLVFGVGAAKSGTSWLHDYLLQHEDCFFRNLKEMHYFDSLDAGMGDFYTDILIRRLTEERENLATHPNRESNTWLPKLITDIQEWMKIFDGKTEIDCAYLEFLGYGCQNVSVIGDITPAYGGSSKSMISHMASLTDRVLFIYLMRDPVERLWSHIRMDAQDPNSGSVDEIVEQYLGNNRPNIAHESDYKGRISQYLEVVPQEAFHIELYEKLFTPKAIEQICLFLGIASNPALFTKIVHKGKGVELDPILRMVFQEKLKPQYEYVGNLLDGLPSEWTEKMVSF